MNAARLTVLTSTSELYMTKRVRRHRRTGRIVKTPYSDAIQQTFRIEAIKRAEGEI
jgi:hypothetical protein